MIEGLVQHDHPLTVQHVLGRMRSLFKEAEVVTLTDGGKTRASFPEVAERAARLASGLRGLGIGESDRVATLAWNTQAHLEAYLAIPSMGSILHTLNLRLFPEQLVYIVNHAEDRVVIIDDSLIPLVAKLVDRLPTVERWIVDGDGDASALGDNVIRYEQLVAEGDADFAWPELDDRAAAALCYTSGTTGNPKGVLYSHRSTMLHSLTACTADCFGLGAADRVLPVVPMFHANAWGIPYAATMAGASLIMPARFLQAEPIAKLLVEEEITLAAAVPTIWLDLLRHVDEHETDLSKLRLVPCGGAAVPRALMEPFQQRHGVHIMQAWGMTETSPLGSVARVPHDVAREHEWDYRTTAGRPGLLLDVRIVDDAGGSLPWDGEVTGELEIRGPWVASGYFRDPEGSAEKMHDGWLRTGDIASIDDRGYIRITDRAKDVIRSGGEWISSVELENELMAHPKVREAAVIAKPDERWTERPLACVVPNEGESVSAAELVEHLVPRVAKWWIPDEYAWIDEVPKTSVGKFDKKVLRARMESGELTERELVERGTQPATS